MLLGDSRTVLPTLPAGSVQAVVTSPPYFGALRDYGVGGIGHEATLDEYVAHLVEVFGEVRRVLRDDGVLWLNLGETWRHKRMLGVPWRVGLALQADGWLWRDSIIWDKGATPDAVRDRCTRTHEAVLLLAKSSRYYFNLYAIREPHQVASLHRAAWEARRTGDRGFKSLARQSALAANRVKLHPAGHNPGSVWTITPARSRLAHGAVMPDALAARCILASTRPGDLVLDLFAGTGTSGVVARDLGRRALLIELNATYAALIHERLGAPVRPVKRAVTLARTTAWKVAKAARLTTGDVLPAHRPEVGKLPRSARARAAAAGISERTQRTLDRLAREHPDLFAQVQAGTLSAHGAAVEAGFVSPRGSGHAAVWEVG
jgi:DNA modification methylase